MSTMESARTVETARSLMVENCAQPNFVQPNTQLTHLFAGQMTLHSGLQHRRRVLHLLHPRPIDLAAVRCLHHNCTVAGLQEVTPSNPLPPHRLQEKKQKVQVSIHELADAAVGTSRISHLHQACGAILQEPHSLQPHAEHALQHDKRRALLLVALPRCVRPPLHTTKATAQRNRQQKRLCTQRDNFGYRSKSLCMRCCKTYSSLNTRRRPLCLLEPLVVLVASGRHTGRGEGIS